jgi:hypothetical protein
MGKRPKKNNNHTGSRRRLYRIRRENTVDELHATIQGVIGENKGEENNK